MTVESTSMDDVMGIYGGLAVTTDEETTFKIGICDKQLFKGLFSVELHLQE